MKNNDFSSQSVHLLFLTYVADEPESAAGWALKPTFLPQTFEDGSA